jgi:RasGEF domain/RasGEF N-terminal motif
LRTFQSVEDSQSYIEEGAGRRSKGHPSLYSPTESRRPSLPDTTQAHNHKKLSFAPGLAVVSDLPFTSKSSSLSPDRSRRGSRPRLARHKTEDSFLDMEEEREEEYRTPDDIPLLERDDDSILEKPIKGVGFTWDALVDRLLSQPLTKTEQNFAPVFMCLYRKFATPGELLDAIIARFSKLKGSEHQAITRMNSQLRYLGILVQWLDTYPGDISHPQTRRRLEDFTDILRRNRLFAVAAKSIRAHLDVLTLDDDILWGKNDADRSRSNTIDSFSTTDTRRSSSSTIIPTEYYDDLTRDLEKVGMAPADLVDFGKRDSDQGSSQNSSDSSISGVHNDSDSHLVVIARAEREAQTLVPTNRTVLTKVQFNEFMMLSDHEIAVEMTRIDWVMFSSIRPRDLIRHVSLSADQKEHCKSLENINRMISHFNHIAYWVANMILFRDKPKHRAKALEKFMMIAWTLRHMNSYNALGAVIAGINGNAVHRLAQTRELIDEVVQKKFMSLEILMGTQKSHFAYRLAWENSVSERIPFLPLHRRDLVSAEEGNRTFVGETGDRINWKKFEIMGDVIIGVQKAQALPYPDLTRNVEIEKLVLDANLSRNDDVSLHYKSFFLFFNSSSRSASHPQQSLRLRSFLGIYPISHYFICQR